MPKDLEGKAIVITGANTGIGRGVAEGLAARGARVVLACRSEEKTRPVLQAIRQRGGQADFVELDLAELASVRRAAEAVKALKLGSAFSVLINNAGLASQPGLTKDGSELTFGVNHLGHFLFTRLLLDALSPPARIVNVSSNTHYRAGALDFERLRTPARLYFGLGGMREYRIAKFCNVLFTKELARRLDPSKVCAYAVHPGVIGSEIWRAVPWPMRSVLVRGMKTSEEGAAAVIRVATALELAGESGRYYHEGYERSAHRRTDDPVLARELWERSERWVGRTP